jgi:hypothetical protein
MGLEGILKGSAAIKDAIERGPKGGGSRFLKLDDGESVTIRFLQELDETGKNYDEERGVAIGFYEHMNPDDWTQAFKCTADTEGKCAGCERAPANKKWRSKGRLLANVVVRGDTDEVKIFGTGLSSKGLAPQLVDFSNDYGSLCDRDYKMTRRGSGIDTTYTLLPRDVSPFTKDDKSHELVDLNGIVRNLTYSEQIEMLTGSGTGDW